MNAFLKSRSAPLLAAAAAGALAVAGFAPMSVFQVPILALWVLLLLCSGARPPLAFLAGFAFGMGLFGVGASWVYVSLHDFGAMGFIRAGVPDPGLLDQIDAVAGLGDALSELNGEEFA